MSELEKGIVKWFNPEKKFGFILQSNGSELFFHINNIKELEMSYSFDNRIIVCKIPSHHYPDPRVGDEVMYEIGRGSKGLIAQSWVFASSYNYILTKIAKTPIYRLMYQINENTPTVEWIGMCPEKCSTYDYKYDRLPFHHDDFSSQKWWESKLKDALETEWKKCEYPILNK